MKKGIFNKSLMAGMLMLPLPLFAAIDVTGSSDN